MYMGRGYRRPHHQQQVIVIPSAHRAHLTSDHRKHGLPTVIVRQPPRRQFQWHPPHPPRHPLPLPAQPYQPANDGPPVRMPPVPILPVKPIRGPLPPIKALPPAITYQPPVFDHSNYYQMYGKPLYDHTAMSGLDDLSGCGCKDKQPIQVVTQSTEIPIWVWLGAGAAVLLFVLKKK